ncbi:MAG: class I SAM-dependent methyltransferase [Synoicihabitans sp.]
MSFDRIAPHYRWLEPVLAGGVLQRARLAHLSVLDEAQNIVLLGEGPGRFLAALRERRPDVPITVIDASRKMLALAKSSALGPTDFVQCDVTTEALPDVTWDGIVSHCFLDCFSPNTLTRVINRVADRARPGANWLITDFALPPGGWRRWRARSAHALMYRAFGIVTRLEAKRWTDPTHALEQSGFRLEARRLFNHGLIQADHWRRA